MSNNPPELHDVPNPEDQKSFAETALELGGKSAEESRRTGVIDQADDQVEALFAPQYQTVNSPAHRAVWDKRRSCEMFMSREPVLPDEVRTVMDESLKIVKKHRSNGSIYDQQQKIYL